MNIKKRNKIIGIVAFLIVLIVIIIVIPILIRLSSHYYTLWFDIVARACLSLDEFVLAIALILGIYFIIRRRKSLKGKKNLILIEMIFGSVIVVFPLIGIGFLLHGFLDWYSLGSLLDIWMISGIPLLVAAILGIILLIHGWHQRKNLRSENYS